MMASTVGTACSWSAWTMPGAVSTSSRTSRKRPSRGVRDGASASESCWPVATRGEYSSTTTGCCVDGRIASLSKVCSLDSRTYDAPPAGAAGPAGAGAGCGGGLGARRQLGQVDGSGTAEAGRAHAAHVFQAPSTAPSARVPGDPRAAAPGRVGRMTRMAHPRAGQPALPEDLIDVDAVISAYYDLVPDPTNPDQQVAFGTSGHRGSSLDVAFNDAHIAATTQAIVEYRAGQGITGPLYLGKDTHALSKPAWTTAIEVLMANGVTRARRERGGLHAHPRGLPGDRGAQRRLAAGDPQADGIVVTPSHNPPRDGGFKYNPPHGGPADSDATS